MLRMNRKPLLITALVICIVGSSLAAYCLFFITSNTVTVNIQYAAVLTSSVTDSTITLDAAVTNNALPARAGLTVDFYYSVDAGVTWTYFATQATDAAGLAQTTYSVTANGAYDFRAIVTVP